MYKLLVLICVLFSAYVANISQVFADDQQFPSLNEAWSVVPKEVQVRWAPLAEQAMGTIGVEDSLEQLRRSARSVAHSTCQKTCDMVRIDKVSFDFLNLQAMKIFTLRDFTYRFIAMAIKNGRQWREVEAGTYQMAVVAVKESVEFWKSIDLCRSVGCVRDFK